MQIEVSWHVSLSEFRPIPGKLREYVHFYVRIREWHIFKLLSRMCLFSMLFTLLPYYLFALNRRASIAFVLGM